MKITDTRQAWSPGKQIVKIGIRAHYVNIGNLICPQASGNQLGVHGRATNGNALR
jgi:hypothetical protein